MIPDVDFILLIILSACIFFILQANNWPNVNDLWGLSLSHFGSMLLIKSNTDYLPSAPYHMTKMRKFFLLPRFTRSSVLASRRVVRLIAESNSASNASLMRASASLIWAAWVNMSCFTTITLLSSAVIGLNIPVSRTSMLYNFAPKSELSDFSSFSMSAMLAMLASVLLDGLSEVVLAPVCVFFCSQSFLHISVVSFKGGIEKLQPSKYEKDAWTQREFAHWNGALQMIV